MKSVVGEYGGAWTTPYEVNNGAGIPCFTEMAKLQ